jgi:DNA-binding MarR family transcriptional regulator
MGHDQIDPLVSRGTELWPSIDPDVEGIVSRISKLQKYLDRLLAQTVKEHGLSPGDYKILVSLGVAGPPFRMTISALRRYHMLSTGGMSVRLDRLERQGFVRRLPDPVDRRRVVVGLTQKGRTVLDRAIKAQAAREAAALQIMGAADRARLNRQLRRLLSAMEGTMGPFPSPDF